MIPCIPVAVAYIRYFSQLYRTNVTVRQKIISDIITYVISDINPFRSYGLTKSRLISPSSLLPSSSSTIGPCLADCSLYPNYVATPVQCRRQVVTPASQDSTAVVEGTSASDVLFLLKTGPDIYREWKTRVANPGESFALKAAS
jgi:hypothetical protein